MVETILLIQIAFVQAMYKKRDWEKTREMESFAHIEILVRQ